MSLSPTQAANSGALKTGKRIVSKRPIALVLSIAALGLAAGPASAAGPAPPCPGGLDTALASPGIRFDQSTNTGSGPATTNPGAARNGGVYKNQATNACT